MKIDDGTRRGARRERLHIVFCQRTVAALPGPLLDKQPGVGRKNWQEGRNCGKWPLRTEATFDELIYANDTAPFTF
jgi:hypothetical protein